MTKINAWHIFGSNHLGPCCACIDHSPHLVDDSETVENSTLMFGDGDLLIIKAQGVDFITDRYVAIRADLLDLDGLKAAHPRRGPMDVDWTLSHSDEETRATFAPNVAGRLIAAGLSIHDAERAKSDPGPQCVITRDGEPVGFVQAAPGLLTLDDIRTVVTVAREMSTGDTPDVLELETVAAVLLAAGHITKAADQ